MAKETQHVKIGKRTLSISNLDKVLYPDEGITKAEIIQYYLTLAPTILKHIKGRALTMIRFPDGIEGEMFYQKNRPDWAPDWLEYIELGSEQRKDYIIATEPASLVWLANMACLEIHQMHSSKPDFDKADYIVYDLDPPEGYNFEHIKPIAFGLREHLESYGYNAFVKTTGGKGVHIVTPIEPKWTINEAFDTAQKLARPFVEKNKETTLQIKKDARKGRVLVDIYRNRTSQSIISAYSLRGRKGAPVAMPVTWEELENLEAPVDYNIHNASEKVLQNGDAWEAIQAYAVQLHDKGQIKAKSSNPPGEKHKSPEQLEIYQKKRDFRKTTEPAGLALASQGNGFVVHRHHASHLHFDLRLEKNGVLRSWAVPKGLPQRPGIKRLAMETEDHPMEYLTFEGSIPKGQYGGGDMWVYALGNYRITREKKNGFYFTLNSPQISGEYRIHQMGKPKEWLFERVDTPQVDWPAIPVSPMLAGRREKVPKGKDYIYEIKWDGIRAIISIDEGKITIRSRNLKDITKQFPELNIPEEAFRTTNGVYDGEIVCLDKEGKPDFKTVIQRMHSRSSTLPGKHPAVCYLFDVLFLDGRSVMHDPWSRRRIWLKDSLRRNTTYRISETVEDGQALLDAAKKMGLEGIMVKNINSLYYSGKRSDDWLKIKLRKTRKCLIIGYTEGKGNRNELFGALQLAEKVDGKLTYRGKVGTGFDQKAMKKVLERLQQVEKIDKPVDETPIDSKLTTWIKPEVCCEVEYTSLTNNGTLRDPVFLSLRPDLSLI
jgi:bifunctional non-homologous end joining protein LigD